MFPWHKVIRQQLPQKQLHNPALPPYPQERFIKFSIQAAYFSIVSTLIQYIGTSIMAQTAKQHSLKFGGGNVNCGNITGSFNTAIYKREEDALVMRWLSPLEPGSRHDSVRTKRFAGVGNWFFETTEFREWRCEGGAGKAILFCSGDPGVGKTYLRSVFRPLLTK